MSAIRHQSDSDINLYKTTKNGKILKILPSLDILQKNKKIVYFFRIHTSMIPQFKDCEPYTYVHPLQPIFIINKDDIYVRFLWECIILFATQEQIDVFDDLRQQYVNYLLVESCSEKYKCDMQIFKRIGSKAQKSDIDYNIESQYSYEIIKRIMNIHQKYFKDNLSDIFDLNFYGSIINYEFTNPVEDYRQTIWSYLRFVEIIEKLSNDKRISVLNSLSLKDKKLYNDTKTKLEQLEHEYKNTDLHKNYATSIQKYHEGNKSQEAYDLFSTSKFFERESYRSVGAFLFVVNNSKKLTVQMLIDCVYDNIGFIAEITVGVTICNVGKYIYRIVRIPKYIARCLEAIKVLRKKQSLKDSKDDEIKKILKFCSRFNYKRKNVQQLVDMNNDIQKFIGILTGKKSKNINNFIDDLENDTGTARVELLMGIYKKLRRFIVKK